MCVCDVCVCVGGGGHACVHARGCHSSARQRVDVEDGQFACSRTIAAHVIRVPPLAKPRGTADGDVGSGGGGSRVMGIEDDELVTLEVAWCKVSQRAKGTCVVCVWRGEGAHARGYVSWHERSSSAPQRSGSTWPARSRRAPSHRWRDGTSTARGGTMRTGGGRATRSAKMRWGQGVRDCPRTRVVRSGPCEMRDSERASCIHAAAAAAADAPQGAASDSSLASSTAQRHRRRRARQLISTGCRPAGPGCSSTAGC